MRRAPLLALLALSACARSFDAPHGTRPAGAPCATAAECATGACTDGVCCASTCRAGEACDLPGTLGLCAPRPLGARCGADGDCPSGHCADGVCCASACGGACYTCARPEDAGHCLPVADGDDPRRDCGACQACYSGVCGPAIAGTDPHGDCEAGQACGADACAAVTGGACASDADCATGYCTGWVCLDLGYARADAYPLLPIDRLRTPIAAASGAGGEAAFVVVTRSSDREDGGSYGELVGLVAPSTAGPWTPVAIDYNAPEPARAAAAFVGGVAFFAVANGLAAQDLGYDPGVYVEGFLSDGTYVGVVDVDPEALDADRVALAAAADGRLLLASRTAAGALRTSVRGVDGRWSTPLVAGGGVDALTGATVNGQALLLLAQGGQLRVRDLSGADELAPGGPAGCSGEVALTTAVARTAGGDVLELTARCAGVTTLGAFDPRQSGAGRWRFWPAPALGVYALTGEEGSEPSTDLPVAELQPAGGLEGVLFYLGFTPAGGAPAIPQGFSTLFWVQADGGLAAAAPSFPDVGYAYLSVASTADALGAPLALYGSSAFVGGQPTQAELLFQAYAR